MDALFGTLGVVGLLIDWLNSLPAWVWLAAAFGYFHGWMVRLDNRLDRIEKQLNTLKNLGLNSY